MADPAQGPAVDGHQATQEMPSLAGPPPSGRSEADGGDVFAERPELFVGAAFAGGLVLAQILKRVRR